MKPCRIIARRYTVPQAGQEGIKEYSLDLVTCIVLISNTQPFILQLGLATPNY